jgi:hypothetical protein
LSNKRLIDALKNYKPPHLQATATPTHPTAAGSMRNKGGLLRKFLSVVRKNKIMYIPQFPYSKKTDYKDVVPAWRQRRDLYPNYDKSFDNFWSCLVIQDRKTNNVYNLYTCNLLDNDRHPGERDYEHFTNVTVPTLKKHEDKLEFKILGWDEGYLKPSWVADHKYFKMFGDQFLKFFEEENSEYYVDEGVYPIDFEEGFVEELEEDYYKKNSLYWRDRNLTDENLGSMPLNWWIQ